jgi:LmbE family N-acetylglucosaminyl deacetylase
LSDSIHRYLLKPRTMDGKKSKTVAIIVAHPDDETLWAGGTILSHPSWKCFVVCLCRKSDQERADRFYKALKVLHSEGMMGDLDDGPEQLRLDEKIVTKTILDLLPRHHYDLVISHNPSGEYTRHIRHEEISKATIKLWNAGEISTAMLWTFAYEDGNKAHFPLPVGNATVNQLLAQKIWLKKYRIMTETYGYKKESWEAKTTPKAEAFWEFKDREAAIRWINQYANQVIC